jgi:hypothetical protein
MSSQPRRISITDDGRRPALDPLRKLYDHHRDGAQLTADEHKLIANALGSFLAGRVTLPEAFGLDDPLLDRPASSTLHGLDLRNESLRQLAISHFSHLPSVHARAQAIATAWSRHVAIYWRGADPPAAPPAHLDAINRVLFQITACHPHALGWRQITSILNQTTP